VKIIGHI